MRMPTADHVARAIVAAARHERINPLWVAQGYRPDDYGGRLAVAHARAYAAMALHRAFPKVQGMSISRMVGSNVPSVFMTHLKRDLSGKHLRWWRDTAFRTVLDAINEGDDENSDLDDDSGVSGGGDPDPRGGIVDRPGDAGIGAREGGDLAGVCDNGDSSGDEGNAEGSSGLSESTSLVESSLPSGESDPAVTQDSGEAVSDGGVEGHARKPVARRDGDAAVDLNAGTMQDSASEPVAGVESGPSDRSYQPASGFSEWDAGKPPRWRDKVSMQAPRSKRALYDMLNEAVRNTGKANE